MLSTKIGIAFGGGGARGIAHVGVIKAFETQNIKPYAISGTSVGAFVAALWAFGKTSHEIEETLLSMSLEKISSFRLGKLGLLSNRNVFDLVIAAIGDKNIEDAPIQLAICCTDLVTGQNIVFTNGSVAEAVQASTCLPGIFIPVTKEKLLLVDGALTDNVPVSAVKDLGANFILGVSLVDFDHHQIPSSMIDVMGKSFDILVDNMSKEKLKIADYLISLNLSHMSRTRIHDAEAAISNGFVQTYTMFSKPIWYWWVKPLFDYFHQIFASTKHLLLDAFSRPKLRGPMSMIQSLKSKK